MPAPLPTLRKKRRRRKKGRKRQLRLFKRTGKKGHRKEAAKHGRAMRKLTALIAKVKRRQINWGGNAPVGGRNLRKVVKFALDNFDVYVTSTNGGTHSPTSYHYRNQAVDIGSNSATEKTRCQVGIYRKFGPGMFAELFGPNNAYFVKDGSAYTATEGEFNENLHDDHVHIAVTS